MKMMPLFLLEVNKKKLVNPIFQINHSEFDKSTKTMHLHRILNSFYSQIRGTFFVSKSLMALYLSVGIHDLEDNFSCQLREGGVGL